MFEALKLIVDSVFKFVPILVERRRDARLAGIGADLMLLYIRMNSTLINAEQILQSLEVFVARMGKHLDDGSDRHATTAASWFTYIATVQRENIAALGYQVNSLSTKWQMVDPDSYVDLGILFRGKMNALDYLLSKLGRNMLPLGPRDAIELVDVASIRGGMPGSSEAQHVFIERMAGAELDLANDSWGVEEYQIVSEYLERRRPRDEIAKIRNSLASLHDALLENFELKDVLLQVEDKRLGSKYGGDSFWGGARD